MSSIYPQYISDFSRYIANICRYIGDNTKISVVTRTLFHVLSPIDSVVNISMYYRFIGDIVIFYSIFPQSTIVGRYRVGINRHPKYRRYIVDILWHFKHCFCKRSFLPIFLRFVILNQFLVWLLIKNELFFFN